jgi:hypothetical protein
MIEVKKQSMLKKILLHSLLLVVFLVTSTACVPAAGSNREVVTLQVPILSSLGGDFPVAGLGVLPEAQRMNPIGFIGSQMQLDKVLKYLQAGDKLLPPVDFSTQRVLYARNTVFYNHLSIAAVTLVGNTLKILSMSTLSAMPIEENVAMSLVVVPRLEAKYLEVAGEKVRLDGI